MTETEGVTEGTPRRIIVDALEIHEYSDEPHGAFNWQGTLDQAPENEVLKRRWETEALEAEKAMEHTAEHPHLKHGEILDPQAYLNRGDPTYSYKQTSHGPADDI